MTHRVAVCEAGVITPIRDAGSRAVADLLAGLTELGYDARMFVEAGRDILADVTAFAPDIIIISRPGLFVRLQPMLAPLRVPIVYLAHDLHFVRVGLQAALTESASSSAGSVMRFVESQCFLKADLSLVPTRGEALRVVAEFPNARCVSMNYFAMPVQRQPIAPPPEFRLVFVGSSDHAPNADGVSWFVSEVWPSVRERRPGAQFLVCGAWSPTAIAAASGVGVSFTGQLSDEDLDATIAWARIAVAPLRFGAGMKRKTLHYLSHGIPVIGTDFAVEGLLDDHSEAPGVIIANSPTQWVAAVDSLDDDLLWRALSAAGGDFVRSNFSETRYREGIERALGMLG